MFKNRWERCATVYAGERWHRSTCMTHGEIGIWKATLLISHTWIFIVLGSGVVTLIELTQAYAIIANGGKKIEPKLITSIYSKDGKKIYDTRLKKCFECRIQTILSKDAIPNLEETKNIIIDPRLAYQITSMMEGVIKRGTAK